MPLVLIGFLKHPDGWRPVKNFPDHIAHYLSTFNDDRSLYAQMQNLSYTLWSEKRRSRFNSTNMQSLHWLQCAAREVSIRESTIYQKTVGWGLFADRSIGRKEVVGYHCGSVVYKTLIGYPIKTKVYAKKVMSVTLANFEKSSRWDTTAKTPRSITIERGLS